MLVRFSCGCPWITAVKPQICGCGCGFLVDIQYRKLAVVVLTMIPKTTVLPQPMYRCRHQRDKDYAGRQQNWRRWSLVMRMAMFIPARLQIIRRSVAYMLKERPS